MLLCGEQTISLQQEDENPVAGVPVAGVPVAGAVAGDSVKEDLVKADPVVAAGEDDGIGDLICTFVGDRRARLGGLGAVVAVISLVVAVWQIMKKAGST